MQIERCYTGWSHKLYDAVKNGDDVQGKHSPQICIVFQQDQSVEEWWSVMCQCIESDRDSHAMFKAGKGGATDSDSVCRRY